MRKSVLHNLSWFKDSKNRSFLLLELIVTVLFRLLSFVVFCFALSFLA